MIKTVLLDRLFPGSVPFGARLKTKKRGEGRQVLVQECARTLYFQGRRAT